MNKEEQTMLEVFIGEYEIESMRFYYMGRMIDTDFIKARAKHFNMQKIVVYGASYLGIQLYKALKASNVSCKIADKNLKPIITIPGINPIGLDELKKDYQNEHIIVTPVRIYHTIASDLTQFIPEDKIMFVGEFIGGI